MLSEDTKLSPAALLHTKKRTKLFSIFQGPRPLCSNLYWPSHATPHLSITLLRLVAATVAAAVATSSFGPGQDNTFRPAVQFFISRFHFSFLYIETFFAGWLTFLLSLADIW